MKDGAGSHQGNANLSDFDLHVRNNTKESANNQRLVGLPGCYFVPQESGHVLVLPWRRILRCMAEFGPCELTIMDYRGFTTEYIEKMEIYCRLSSMIYIYIYDIWDSHGFPF